MKHSKSVVHCPLFLCRVVNGMSDLKDWLFSVSQCLLHIKYLCSSSGLGKVQMDSLSQELSRSTIQAWKETQRWFWQKAKPFPQYRFFFNIKKQKQANKEIWALDFTWQTGLWLNPRESLQRPFDLVKYVWIFTFHKQEEILGEYSRKQCFTILNIKNPIGMLLTNLFPRKTP